MRQVILLPLMLFLIAGACSSGIDEDVHAAALENASQANARVGELETKLSNTEDDLAGTQSDVSQLESNLTQVQTGQADAEAEAEGLRQDVAGAQSELETARSDLDAALETNAEVEGRLAQALDRFGDLVDITQIPNTPGSTLIGVLITEAVTCGVSGFLPGFSEAQPDGSAKGFDADFCRAVAAAVLGDADAVRFRFTTAAERFDILRAGRVDVLMRNSTSTLSRDGSLAVGVDFGTTTFYDGQQLMGRTDRFGVAPNAGDVDGAAFCGNPGTTTTHNATSWATSGGSSLTVVEVTNINESMDRLLAGEWYLVSTDGSALAGRRANLIVDGTIDPGELVIFPRAPLSKEPLAPVYRQWDAVWADIVNWVVYATIIADEKGITSANIDSIEWDAEAQRLFGVDAFAVTSLGLAPDAFYQVIKQVGNYGEIFERNLGPVGFTRAGTLNAPFFEGGMIYAPPAR